MLHNKIGREGDRRYTSAVQISHLLARFEIRSETMESGERWLSFLPVQAQFTPLNNNPP